MTYYIVRRTLLAVPVLILVLTIAFTVIRLAPGDVAYVILGDFATPEAITALRQRLGLDQPMIVQYGEFLVRFATGNFGNSLRDNTPIAPQIIRVLPYTVDLALSAIALALLIGVPLGIVSAVMKNHPIDHIIRVVSLAGLSMPSFYLGALLLLVFSVRLGWFPVLGGGDLANIQSRLHHLALPAITLGLIEASFVTRMARASMLEILRADYMRTARSKGLAERVVIVRHGLRNALIPIITLVGLFMGTLLGGSILTETVFSRPGLGTFLLNAIRSRDYPALESGIALFAVLVVLVNLLVDLMYAVVDPRVRYS